MTDSTGEDTAVITQDAVGTGAADDTAPETARSGGVSSGGAAPRRRRWWRRVPLLVWVVTGLHVALMTVCTLIYPPFTGYDEVWHVDMTWSYYTGHGVYDPGERFRDRGIDAASALVQVPPPRIPYADAPVPARGERRSFRQLNDGGPLTYPAPNQMVQHPPLYYLTEAGLLHLVPGGGDLPYDRVVWLLRLGSVLMLAPLPLLCWATARRLLGNRPAAEFAALIPVTIPGLSRLGGSVNNDNLLILLTSALLYVLVRVVTGDLRRRTGLLAGVLTTLCLLTKGFALALPVVVAAAYCLAWWRHRRRPLAPFGIATAVVAVFGSAWWVRNLVLYGAVQPSGLGDYWTKQIVGPARPGGTVQDFVPGFFERLVRRTWGGFGLIDVPRLPDRIVDTWFLFVVAGVLLTLVYGVGRYGRWTTLVLSLPMLGIIGIVFVGALNRYLFNVAYAGVQGRYLYPGLLGLAVLAGWGWCRLAGRGARFVPLVVLVAGLATQAYAWWLLLGNWWAPHSGAHGLTRIRQALAGVRRWSPWPDALTVVPFVLAVVLAAAALALAVWAVLRRTVATLDEPVDDLPDAAALP